VAVAAVAAYVNTLGADFTLDDVPIVVENGLITDLGNIPVFFTTNYWGDSVRFTDKSLYRPLVIASYALNYAVHGLHPRGYHVVNVLLHAVACVLLFFLIRALFEDHRLAAVAALAFAVHPVHTEVVAGIVGRAEIMALVGTLTCCLGYCLALRVPGPRNGGSRWAWLSLSILGYGFGMFSKEIGVVAPVLILLWEVLLPARRRLLRGNLRAVLAFAAFVGVACAYLALRDAATRGMAANLGFIHVAPIDRVWTALRVCLEYVGLLVAPIRLSADYWITQVPIARAPWEPGVAAAIVVLLAMSALCVWSWRRVPAVAWGTLGFLAILFPVSNLPFAIGVMKAERLLYSPSAAFLVAVAALWTALSRRQKSAPLAWALFAVAGALLLVRTWVRNEDWRDNHALAVATLRTSPESPIFNTVMANWLRARGQNAEARTYMLQALKARPDDAENLYNLGNIELDEKHHEAAIGYYQDALERKPEFLSAINNLGRSLMDTNRLQEAAETFNRARKLRPADPAAYVNLSAVYIRLEDLASAERLIDEALRRFPNVAALHWNAFRIYQKLGRTGESKAAFQRAKELDPKIVETPDTRVRLD